MARKKKVTTAMLDSMVKEVNKLNILDEIDIEEMDVEDAVEEIKEAIIHGGIVQISTDDEISSKSFDTLKLIGCEASSPDLLEEPDLLEDDEEEEEETPPPAKKTKTKKTKTTKKKAAPKKKTTTAKKKPATKKTKTTKKATQKKKSVERTTRVTACVDAIKSGETDLKELAILANDIYVENGGTDKIEEAKWIQGLLLPAFARMGYMKWNRKDGITWIKK